MTNKNSLYRFDDTGFFVLLCAIIQKLILFS